MKKTAYLFATLMFTLISCHTDNDDHVLQASISLNFSHNWDGELVTNAHFNTIQYTNENGEELSIEKLRYVISKITFHKANQETIVLDGYNLVDVTNATNLLFTSSTKIPLGQYSNMSFTFGFDDEDNSKNYPDLNAASWTVPEMLGSGYHFMQLEGKFINNTNTQTGYAYHAIRAVNNTGTEQVLQDTSIVVNLGSVNITNNTTFNIVMNIAQWFKDPNTWDLNDWHTALMPNFNAQIMMYENGQNVFSLESIIQ